MSTQSATAEGPVSDAIEWFYEKNGTRIGQMSTAAMRQLLDQGDISHDTLAWNQSFGQNWRPVRDTELPVIGAPPPLPASHVNASFVWLLD